MQNQNNIETLTIQARAATDDYFDAVRAFHRAYAAANAGGASHEALARIVHEHSPRTHARWLTMMEAHERVSARS